MKLLRKLDRPPTDLTRIKTWPLIVLLMALATALGVVIFSKTSLRLDEAQSLFQTSRNVPGLLYLVAQDVHVPGYHLLLHVWTLLFSGDITTARYMSLVFMVLTIPAVYYLAAFVFSRRVGIVAALLTTLSPFMEWYASEARMYSMLALFTVLHQILFLKILRAGKPIHWILFTLVTVGGLYTHYFFSFVILTELLYFIVFRKLFPAKSFRKFIVTGVVALAAFAPWLLYVVRLGTASNTQPHLAVPTSGDLFDTYAQFIFGFQVPHLNTIIVSLWPVIVLLAFFGLQRNRKTPPEAFFFVMASVVPVIGAFILSVTFRPFFLSRYLIVALPALLILIAWSLSLYEQRLRRILQSLLCAAVIVLLYIQTVNPNTPVKEDYRTAVTYLEAHASSRDVVVVAAPFTIYPTEYYYDGPAKLTTQPIWNRFEQGSVPAFDQRKLAAETSANVMAYQKAWLMLSYDQGYNDTLKNYYDNHFERLSKHSFSPNLTIYEYKVRYDPRIMVDN